MRKLLIDELLDKPFNFSTVPDPIPGDLRPLWRIAVLLIILSEGSRGQKASLQKLQVMSWILENRDKWEEFAFEIKGGEAPERVVVRFDPAVNLALELAIGEGLVEVESRYRIRLGEKGLRLCQEISCAEDILLDEMEFTRKTKSALTESNIQKLLTWEG